MYAAFNSSLGDGVRAKLKSTRDGVAIMSPGGAVMLLLTFDEADSLARQIRTILCDSAAEQAAAA